MKVDAYATMDHWFDHAYALYKHLEPDHRGTFYMGSYDLCGAAGRNGPTAQAIHPTRSERPILVASWRDAERCLRVGRKVILMEHGIGQSFIGTDNASYSGSSEHRKIALRLVPNEYAAEAHRKTLPDVPVAVIGCPKLDDLLGLVPVVKGPVALSNHWGDSNVSVPEMGGAWFQWHEFYDAIPKAFPGALGHAHPKLWGKMNQTLAALGFEPVRWFGDVCRRAEVYVCDGVSTLYEFAALDRPVVVLNPPSFRRDVHHGGRFWTWADVGVQVDDPTEITEAIIEARREQPSQVARRRQIVAEVYPHLGTAGLTGAQAIQAHFG